MAQNSLPVVAIKEANTHLQALYDQNQKLENQVSELRRLLAQKTEQEVTLAAQIAEWEKLYAEQRNAIDGKDNQIVYLQSEITNLSKQLEGNNKVLLMNTELRRKLVILADISKHKYALEKIVSFLDLVDEDLVDAAEEMVQTNSVNGIAIKENIIESDFNHIDKIDEAVVQDVGEAVKADGDEKDIKQNVNEDDVSDELGEENIKQIHTGSLDEDSSDERGNLENELISDEVVVNGYHAENENIPEVVDSKIIDGKEERVAIRETQETSSVKTLPIVNGNDDHITLDNDTISEAGETRL